MARKQAPAQGFTGDEFSAEAASHPSPWIPVSSSRVNQIRYDSGLQQVQVIFRDGTPWTYDSVPPEVWSNFETSDSKGRFINTTLNGYPYWRGAFDATDDGGGE